MRALALVTAALAVAVLVGCGGESETEPGGGSDGRTTQVERSTPRSETTRSRPTRPAWKRAGLRASPARQRTAIASIVRRGRPVYCGGGRHRYVALTFDDGPGPWSRAIQRSLRAHGARATFFVLGSRAVQNRRTIAAYADRDELGNHTWSHPDLTALGRRAVREQIERTQVWLERLGGRSVNLFRSPYGARDRTVDRLVRRLRMAQVLWDVDSRDAVGAHDWRSVKRNVLASARPGSIVLMHEIKPQTVKALRPILRGLKKKRLTPITVGELLALDPPSRRQARAGYGGCR